MSLKLNERYPGRFNNPTAGYPQGSFKNRTTPTAKDGSYLEKDWANDKEGFFQSLLSDAGVVANGVVDSVGSSQFFDAMKTTVRKASFGIVGATANLKMLVSTASSTATITADEITVKSGLAGRAWTIGGFNKVLNLANAGALGMDVLPAPNNGWLAIYAGLNEATGATTAFAQSVGNTVAPAVYGGANAPAGITATALLTVVPTNGSGQIKVCSVSGKKVRIQIATLFSSSAVVSNTPFSISGVVPANAIEMFGEFGLGAGASTTFLSLTIAPDITFLGQQNKTALLGTGQSAVDNYANVPIHAPQLAMVTTNSTSGTPSFIVYATGYVIS